jgi:uncharacterized RDD family membrane protein YckC
MEEAPLSTQPISAGAGFAIRTAARAIDILYGTGLGLVGGVLGGIILTILEATESVSPGWQGRIQGFSLMAFFLSLVGGFLYHSFMEGIHGASLGKLICRLRVVTENGKPIGMKAAALRSLAYYFDGLFFGLVAYGAMKTSPLNQRYGDRWAHTVVIKSKELPVGADRGIGYFLGAFAMGTTCWTLLLASGLIWQAR